MKLLRYATAVAAAYLLACGYALSAQCPWYEPGAAPYGPNGDLSAAVQRLTHIPEQHREALILSLRQDTPSEVTRITSTGLQSKRFRSPRNMNFAGGRICWGALDVSMWPVNRSQIVRVHTSGPYAIGHYPGCGNISELTDTFYKPGVAETIRGLGRQDANRSGAVAVNTVPIPGSFALTLTALAALALRVGRRT